MQKLTPMMEQYMEIKKQHQDCILFFRLGDFYEMFFEDALTASAILDITLTGKSCGMEERAPMCGVPYHSADYYIQKLILAGKKVAICEQVENPAEAKGIVKREVIRIITPGTVLDEAIIPKNRNNYLMGIAIEKKENKEEADCLDISFIDISTGDISTRQVPFDEFADLFHKVGPVELIWDRESEHLLQNGKIKNAKLIFHQIKTRNIVINYPLETEAASAEILQEKRSLQFLFRYIEYTQKSLSLPDKWKEAKEECMVLDQFTFRNLELVETLRGGKEKGSLLWVLDKTRTAMGARMLKSWIEYPLLRREDIEERLEKVDTFYQNPSLLRELPAVLREIHDIERICTKLIYDNSKHQDLIKLKHSLAVLPAVKCLLEEQGLSDLAEKTGDFSDLLHLLEEAIEEPEDDKAKNLHLIRSSYDQRLKELRDIIEHSADIILQLEQREREKTGVKTLKIGYNKVFGYYIEITKAGLKNVAQLPSDYIRKQTLASAERYINEELKSIEEKILNAKEQADVLEQSLYTELKQNIKSRTGSLMRLAHTLALIDSFCSLAKTAFENGYCRPVIADDGELIVVGGRHPVVEKMLPEENFIPNDSSIENNKIHIITGPNMAGKSTYMRQLALIVLMAHIGSFVPCNRAKIGLIDKVFTRVGASDDLSQGQSTFMVEMSELSNILKNATCRSLIILDEIGRGTSTYDGMSIAYSVIEYLQEKIGAKALVSTHYHEITSLEEKYPSIENYCMAVHEERGDIRFLRKVIRGKSDKSYGIHVAKLAALPKEIIDKAYKILYKLEKDHTVKLRDSFGTIDLYEEKGGDVQLSFEQIACQEVFELIRGIDLNNTTPIRALNLLSEIKSKMG